MRRLSKVKLQGQLARRTPKLEFSGTPLCEVVARMNRHNRRQFVLADEAVGGLRVRGLLRADKRDTMAEMLETDFAVRVERHPDEIVLRSGK